mmetsp:Transcript_38851/g.76380  ORF Transcript_38851/g.76380 Transcript_38851/m.76380 type:complete len:114 (-) Transcript_38851:191-532(-)
MCPKGKHMLRRDLGLLVTQYSDIQNRQKDVFRQAISAAGERRRERVGGRKGETILPGVKHADRQASGKRKARQRIRQDKTNRNEKPKGTRAITRWSSLPSILFLPPFSFSFVP